MKEFSGFLHGVDLGGWFSQCDYSKDRFENFIVEKDFEELSGWGIDHVRLPVDYNLLETEDGSAYLEEGFAYLERAILWCKKYHLNMVLDLHKTAGFSFDAGEAESGFFTSEKLQERFYRLWEEISRRFASYTGFVAFELLNEVTDKDFMPAWNRIASTCIGRIRAICPDVYILMGGYWNNSIDALPDIDVPVDEHIVFNFHCYEPFPFTHQGAYWVSTMPRDYRVQYPLEKGSAELEKALTVAPGFAVDAFSLYGGSEYFVKRFETAVKAAEAKNVALYCGEYGAINLADVESTVRWYKDIHDAFEKYGIARAAWSYRQMDFGLCDEHMAGAIDRVKKLL